jgi:hypothetical protein
MQQMECTHLCCCLFSRQVQSSEMCGWYVLMYQMGSAWHMMWNCYLSLVQHVLSHVKSDTSVAVGATCAVTRKEWHISRCWCNTCRHIWRVTHQSLLVQHVLSHMKSDTSVAVGATRAVTRKEWHISHCWCNTCCHIWRVTHQLLLVQHMLSHVKSDTSVAVGAARAITYEEWHISCCLPRAPRYFVHL